MTTEVSAKPVVLIVGAGIMGGGIAQIAARHGHDVLMFDIQPERVKACVEDIRSQLEQLIQRGKFSAADVEPLLTRIKPLDRLEDARDARVVIEAVVEDLQTKQSLFIALEKIVGPECILATNTSSISVTAIGKALETPGRLVGMHFFNPAQIMKLVEVVSGLKSDPKVVESIFHLAKAWGKTPIRAKSTPGFVVNRIARPFYAEALLLLQEQFASAGEIDSCIRAAGFRMGPCELMDLIGHDTNFAVTRSVFDSNFYDKRFVPSLIQHELVEGGLYGRKTGLGLFDYSADQLPTKTAAAQNDTGLPLPSSITVNGRGTVPDFLREALAAQNISTNINAGADWSGLVADEIQIRVTDGRPASQVAADEGIRNIAVVDWMPAPKSGMSIAWACAAQADDQTAVVVQALLSRVGCNAVAVRDYPGLAVARTLSMIINEAADAVVQGVCTDEDADLAMTLGTNYPAGPFQWLKYLTAAPVLSTLNALNDFYRGERYRVSPGLRERGWKASI